MLDPYELISRCRPGILQHRDCTRGYSLQARTLAQLVVAMMDTAGKEAVDKLKVLLHVNEEQQDDAIKELWDNKFLGWVVVWWSAGVWWGGWLGGGLVVWPVCSVVMLCCYPWVGLPDLLHKLNKVAIIYPYMYVQAEARERHPAVPAQALRLQVRPRAAQVCGGECKVGLS